MRQAICNLDDGSTARAIPPDLQRNEGPLQGLSMVIYVVSDIWHLQSDLQEAKILAMLSLII